MSAITRLLLKYYFRHQQEYVMGLGSIVQPGSLFAAVPSKDVWKKENFLKKVKCILSRKYIPSDDILQQLAKNTLIADIFGGLEDYGIVMLHIAKWHHSQSWELNHLTTEDVDKANAASIITVSTRTRFKNFHYNIQHLELAKRAPEMIMLITPMVIKIPVLAVRYYLDIHYEFAFNSIRKSGHPQADALVGYLYEVSLLQHKTATALHEIIRLILLTRNKKENTLLIGAEVDAVSQAELAITYLKASIEKMINLVALTFSITKLEEKKTHKQKIEALKSGIPKDVQSLFYWETVLHFVSSENIEDLNRYRTGMVHKMGVSKLQPHRIVGKKLEDSSFMEIYNFLHEQHAKNTVVFVGVLAILTDELVRRDPLTNDNIEKFNELAGTVRSLAGFYDFLS